MPPFQPRFTQSSQQETVKHTLRPIDEPQMHPKPIAPLVSGGALGRSPLKVFLAVMLTMIFLALTASISVKSYVAMRSHMQQEHQQILLLAEQLRDQEDFQSCVEVLSNISFISPVYQQSQILRNTCLTSLDEALFNKAQTSAAEGRFKEAIQLAKKISSSQYIDSAQTFIHDCSTRILQIAEQYYLDPSGTLATAVSVARTVADDDENPMHQQAQALIDRWQMDWLIQENHFQAAQRALNLGQLDLALTNAQKITHPHYLEKIKPVIEAVQARRIELENFLEQAQQSLLIGEIERAIYFATKLPDTEPWTTQKAQVLEQAKSIQINRERRWQSVLWLLGLFVVVLSALAGRR